MQLAALVRRWHAGPGLTAFVFAPTLSRLFAPRAGTAPAYGS